MSAGPERTAAEHEWNGDPEEFNPAHPYLSDFSVASFLAHQSIERETMSASSFIKGLVEEGIRKIIDDEVKKRLPNATPIR